MMQALGIGHHPDARLPDWWGDDLKHMYYWWNRLEKERVKELSPFQGFFFIVSNAYELWRQAKDDAELEVSRLEPELMKAYSERNAVFTPEAHEEARKTKEAWKRRDRFLLDMKEKIQKLSSKRLAAMKLCTELETFKLDPALHEAIRHAFNAVMVATAGPNDHTLTAHDEWNPEREAYRLSYIDRIVDGHIAGWTKESMAPEQPAFIAMSAICTVCNLVDTTRK